MKKIIETVAEGGGELGVHMYPFFVWNISQIYFLHFGYCNTGVCGFVLHERISHMQAFSFLPVCAR